MKKFLLCLTICLLVVVVGTALLPIGTAKAQSNTLPSGTADADIGAAIDNFLQQHQSNHAAVATAIFRGNEDIYKCFYGYIDALSTQPLDADCVLEWGSTTKLTVWLSAIQLVERGKLSLDADIRTYLPDGFLRNLRFDAPVTMLNLMNHNAGFQETDFVLEVEDLRDIIPLGAYLSTYQPLQVFAPGTVVAYSNWGAALAGYVVECIAQMPYWQYVQQNIFAPLGMTHTAIAADLSDNPWVQQRRNDFVSYLPDGSLSPDNNKVYILPYPAGMCTGTLDDMLLFAKALINRDAALLSAQSFDLLYSPSLLYTNTDRGRIAHGFLIDYDFAVPVVGHDGNTLGCSSRLLLDLDNNIGMVVLTNQLGGSLYRTQMAKLVFGETQYHIPLDGHYEPMRTIIRGKNKFLYGFLAYNHLHLTKEMTDGLYLNVLPDKFEISTCDYVAMGGDYRARDALAILWFVLLGYAAINLLVRLAFAIKGAIKKTFDKFNLANMGYSVLLILTAVTIEPLVSAITGFILMVVLAAVSIAIAVYQCVAYKKICVDKSTKISYWQTWSLLLCTVVSVCNLFVWDLIAFWL